MPDTQASSSYTGDVAEPSQILTRPAWHADAACKEHPDVSWFPARGESAAAAKAICRTCLARPDCAAYITGLPNFVELVGVWAGTTGRERKAMGRAAMRAAA